MGALKIMGGLEGHFHLYICISPLLKIHHFGGGEGCVQNYSTTLHLGLNTLTDATFLNGDGMSISIFFVMDLP